MDTDTIELCWSILEQYIKANDRDHAVNHLVNELLDNGLDMQDLKVLAGLDKSFEKAVAEYKDDEWYEDEHDDWQ